MAFCRDLVKITFIFFAKKTDAGITNDKHDNSVLIANNQNMHPLTSLNMKRPCLILALK